MSYKKIESQKIDSRYHLAKIDGKFYIIDYANAKKLGTYLTVFTEYKKTWTAWEITEKEAKKFFQRFHPKKISSGYYALVTGIGLLASRYLYSIIDSSPKIELSMSMRLLLLAGILVFPILGVLIARVKQSNKNIEIGKQVKIYSKTIHPIICFIFILMYLLFVYALFYFVLVENEMKIAFYPFFLFFIDIFIFIQFIGSPANRIIYKIEKVKT